MNWKSFLPLIGLVMIGCQQPAGPAPGGESKLITAKLDTLPILQNDPQYQELAKSYTVENIELSKGIKKLVDEGKLDNRQASLEYLKQQEALNKKWMKNTNDFIQTRHSKMREAVKQLCEEKGIDMVLIDSKAYRTVEYGAFDITQDILMKIYGNPLGGTPTPGGTPK